jgi:hypothetical protein
MQCDFKFNLIKMSYFYFFKPKFITLKKKHCINHENVTRLIGNEARIEENSFFTTIFTPSNFALSRSPSNLTTLLFLDFTVLFLKKIFKLQVHIVNSIIMSNYIWMIHNKTSS